MAYPVTVGTPYTGYDFGSSPVGQFGFTYSSNLYLLLLEEGNGPLAASGADNKLHLFKSTDAGLTWSEVDAAHAPTGPIVPPNTNFQYGTGYSPMVDGSTLYIAIPQYTGTSGAFVMGELSIRTFNLSTGLWGSSTNYAAPVLDFTTSAGLSYQYNGQIFVDLVKRGSGDYILFYSSAIEVVSTVTYARLSYATFNGTVFGTGTPLPGQSGVAQNFYGGSACCDSALVTHFIFFTDSLSAVYHVGLSNVPAFGTVQTLTTSAYYGAGGPGSPLLGSVSPVILVSNIPEEMALAVVLNAGLTMFYATAALNPSWSTSLINSDLATSSYPLTQIYQVVWLVYLSSQIACFWITGGEDSGDCLWSVTDSTALSWAAPTSFIAQPTYDGNPANDSQIYAWGTGSSFAAAMISISSGSPGDLLTQFNFSSFSPPSVGIICNSPPGGVVGVAYSHAFPASGGTPPYTFSIISGSLPTGLSLNSSTGVVSGTPSGSPGTSSFTIQAEDSTTATASVACSIAITAAVTIGCGSPPASYVGAPYLHTFPISGGTAPFTFSISAGSLPPGLTLNTTTGIVSGFPTTAGTYSFTIAVTGS